MKALKIIAVVSGVVIAFAVAAIFLPESFRGFGASSPDSQRAWIAQFQDIRDRWKEAQSNDVRREAIENEARAFFNDRRNVTDWWGVVDGVKSALGGTGAVVKYRGATFKLYPESTDAANAFTATFSRLRQGDDVLFSGTLMKETSFTMSGAMSQPEMQVRLTELKRR